MINTDTVQALMRHRGSAPHADRILCQLNYAMSLSGALGGKWDEKKKAVAKGRSKAHPAREKK